jgi:ABC-2 type transport system ATP-binding protein
MGTALGIHGVEVYFDRFTLGPVELDLEAGRVVGLVGPNGSGKTTTIRCVAGNMRRNAGSIDVCGRRAAEEDGSWKEAIGYVPDSPVFFEWMTAGRFLDFMSRFYPTWSGSFAADLARRFQLDLHAKTKHMSTGNRVKLSLVAALAHKPRLALFDEPTAGLDPVVRTEVFDVLCEMMESDDMTVLYSTHIVDDLHRLADDLVFLIDGKVRLHEAKDDLVDHWRRIRFQHTEPLSSLDGVMQHERDGRLHELVTPDGDKTAAELAARGAESIAIEPLTLEEIAVQIMKGN